MHRSRASMPLTVHCLHRSGFRELLLTAAPYCHSGVDAARPCFEQLAATLAEHHAELLAMKVYGAHHARTAILTAWHNARSARGLIDDTPVHFLDGRPCDGGEFAGAQAWALVQPGARVVSTVTGGRLATLPHGRLLHLTAQRGESGATFAQQAEQMFAAAAAAAEHSGFHFAQTARTWIYLADLLPDYAELNRVRSAFYERARVGWPASTGIQARAGDAACVMDVLLLDGVRTHRIDRTSRQCPASAYGSAFSRGVVLEHPGGRTVHVSGTASIGGDGHSRHAGDAMAQYLETLVDVGAVLAEAGMTLADIVQATLFCKTPAVHAACVEAHALLGLPPLPMLAVHADVCRRELLVELEAVACR
ncbi:MAG: hypothetical protein JNN13_02340 [Planctomycetes bacterium]|nr:hypothetical protein [Planctomycetota bacterium]